MEIKTVNSTNLLKPLVICYYNEKDEKSGLFQIFNDPRAVWMDLYNGFGKLYFINNKKNFIC